MISFSNVNKRFPGKTALKDISFDAREGDVIGFLGPNGAGKTTTMRLLLGYLAPTRGIVRVNGKDPIEDRMGLLENIGYLPENNPLYPEMSVHEYLRFIADVRCVRDIKGTIIDVGLETVLHKKIEELSRGYKQRVGLAAALLADPQILILDEPTSGLDPLEQEKIRTLIQHIAKNKTIMFSTHMLSEVEAVATRLIIINNGIIVYDGNKPKGKGAVERLFRKVVH